MESSNDAQAYADAWKQRPPLSRDAAYLKMYEEGERDRAAADSGFRRPMETPAIRSRMTIRIDSRQGLRSRRNSEEVKLVSDE
jgi:hypothetical protein